MKSLKPDGPYGPREHDLSYSHSTIARMIVFRVLVLIVLTGTSCATASETSLNEFSNPTAQAAAEAIVRSDLTTLRNSLELEPSIVSCKSSGNYDLLDISLLYDKPELFSLLLEYEAFKTKTVDERNKIIRRLAVQERYAFLEALVDAGNDLLYRNDNNLDLIEYLLVQDNSRYYFSRILKVIARQHKVFSGEYVLSASYAGKWTMMADLLAYDIDFMMPRPTLELVYKDVSLVRSRGGKYPETDRQLEIVVGLLRERFGYEGN